MTRQNIVNLYRKGNIGYKTFQRLMLQYDLVDKYEDKEKLKKHQILGVILVVLVFIMMIQTVYLYLTTAVAETIRTTLGPKGMDKMLVSPTNDIIITNDGVTILEEMQIEHPAAKMIVEIAKTQESEVGDGTTTAVMIAGKLLENAEKLLDKKIHPTTITKGYRIAAEKCLEFLNDISHKVTAEDEDTLKQIAIGLSKVNAPKHRLSVIKTPKFNILDDSYNSSPAALEAARSAVPLLRRRSAQAEISKTEIDNFLAAAAVAIRKTVNFPVRLTIWAAGLALAARERPQAVEAARDRADEAPFAPAIGRHRAEDRRGELVGPVRAAQALDRAGGTPTGFEQIVDAAAVGALAVAVGMIAAAGPTSIGESQDRLAAGHEGVGLTNVAARRPAFDLLPAAAVDDQPAGPSGYLGNRIGTKFADQLVERCWDCRHRTQALNEVVASLKRGLGVDRIAVLVDHQFRARFAVGPLEHAHHPGREGGFQIVDHIFPRAELEIEMGALVCRKAGQAPVQHCLGGGDQLDDNMPPFGDVLRDCTNDGW